MSNFLNYFKDEYAQLDWYLRNEISGKTLRKNSIHCVCGIKGLPFYNECCPELAKLRLILGAYSENSNHMANISYSHSYANPLATSLLNS